MIERALADYISRFTEVKATQPFNPPVPFYEPVIAFKQNTRGGTDLQQHYVPDLDIEQFVFLHTQG